jgi:AAA15 family ATPase/GTPase
MQHKGKRLMIDEIDAGIHHSRMEIYWQTILQAAALYDVQLFMTTHSLECLQKFKNVVEMPDFITHQKNIRMIELRETADKKVKAATFLYQNFAADLENQNEVRGGASW